MLLVRLTEENVAEYWDIVRYAMRSALPPTAMDSPEKLNNILESLLLGKTQAWVVLEEPDSKQLRALLTTYIHVDEASKTRTLMLYTIHAFLPLGEDEANAVYEGVMRYAKANKCNKISTYTDDENVISILAKYGMKQQYVFLTIIV